MKSGAKGAQRQRPIGRYKIDNQESPTMSDIFDDIDRRIEDHYLDTQDTLQQGVDSMNLFLIHSLGGGTGSGTYPLVSAMVNEAAQRVANDYNIFVYTGAIGIVPKVGQDPSLKDLRGEPRYYANSYAALEDLRKLIETQSGEPLRLPVYARRYAEAPGEEAMSTNRVISQALETNGFPLHSPPFDNYFIVDINQDKISSDDPSGNETYAEMIDSTVAESIYALSKFGPSTENFVTQTNETIGTVAETEIAVPYEELQEYCRIKERIATLEDQLFAGDDGVDSQLRIQKIARNPETVLDTVEDPETVRSELDERADDLGDGITLHNRDRAQVRKLIDDIKTKYSLRFVPLALDILQDRFDEALLEMQEEHEEVVSELWMDYNMSADSEFGGTHVSSVNARARNLRDYFEANIEETEQLLEELEPSFWDGLPIIEGERETEEAWLETLEDDLERLMEEDQKKEQLESLASFVANKREEAETTLEDKSNELMELRTNLRSERRTLTDTSRQARRVGYLPIEEEAIDGLDTETLAEFDSLSDFVGDYIDESFLQTALETQYEDSFAWHGTIMNRDFSGLDVGPGRPYNQTWLLYSEENRDVVETRHLTTEGEFLESSGESMNYITDPYRLKFVSFTRQGPLEALETYRKLKDYAERGALDQYIPGNLTYRHAFAYPEWYSRDIRQAFDLKDEVTLPYPPEPDLGAVDKRPEESGGEFKNRIVTNGISLYLFEGVRWEDYSAEGDGEPFLGWGEDLDEVGLGFQALQHCSPDAETKHGWTSGQIEWETVVGTYCNNIAELEDVEIEFEETPTPADD
jgi:hypothetical protein